MSCMPAWFAAAAAAAVMIMLVNQWQNNWINNEGMETRAKYDAEKKVYILNGTKSW